MIIIIPSIDINIKTDFDTMDKCESCGNMFESEWTIYFDKIICYDCDDKFCQRCQSELDPDKEDISDCNLCGSKYCTECTILTCSICYGDKTDKCFNCFGSVIELPCCQSYACISCIMYNDNDDIVYSKKYDNYICQPCFLDEEDDENITESINSIDYILENSDNFIPKLNEYMMFMVQNPGYRGSNFM